MPRWTVNGEDAAALFGAIHRGLIDPNGGEEEIALAITEWLRSNPSLERKYQDLIFETISGGIFEDWRRYRATAVLALANVDLPARNEDRVRGHGERPGSDHGQDSEDNDLSLASIGDREDEEQESLGDNEGDNNSTGTNHSDILDLNNLQISATSTVAKMFIDSFPGPNFVTESLNGGFIQVTQKSLGILVYLQSGVDVSSIEHKITVVSKKYAKLSLTVKQHEHMMNPLLITPIQSNFQPVISCKRLYLQARLRRGSNIIKGEKMFAGDFQDGFVQPSGQNCEGECEYRAVNSSVSPFRIANVGSSNGNHLQGVVLETYLLYKLEEGTIGALQAPEYRMPPQVQSPPPAGRVGRDSAPHGTTSTSARRRGEDDDDRKPAPRETRKPVPRDTTTSSRSQFDPSADAGVARRQEHVVSTVINMETDDDDYEDAVEEGSPGKRRKFYNQHLSY
ncbi:hypothetical protein MHU86_21295 [Fragilaria crotonensis]|nr:hypothetical protein MHU86_21295 [Fragilaria crotonensis]